MYVTILYIEGKLDSYGKDNNKLYNKYFGGYFGLSDYTDNYGINLYDKVTKNVANKKKEKEKTRQYFQRMAT